MADMKIERVKAIATELYQAWKTGITLPHITDTFPDMTLEDAYAIQKEGIGMRIEAGERVIGAKIGLTSRAMMDLFQVYEPDYSLMTDSMVRSENEAISVKEFNLPMVEVEVAFLLKEDIQGPGVSEARVISATAGVLPSIEIIDTRYHQWSRSVICSVADLAGIRNIILGGRMTPLDGLDLRYVGMVFEKNGEIIDTAAGAAVMGNPVTSVAWLVNRLGCYGIGLHAGDIVMSGSLIRSVKIQAGDEVRGYFDRLGDVRTRFTD